MSTKIEQAEHAYAEALARWSRERVREEDGRGSFDDYWAAKLALDEARKALDAAKNAN